ncbi:MAG: hypothetical protein CR986_10425 [Ignavibacteriae bacterium]|nr:MAG: hypothetical protein CR986_10425 [Ignavibacteriota bacterium]
MTKKKKNQNKKTKSNLFKNITLVVIAAFIILMLSDLFFNEKKINTIPGSRQTAVYKFTKEGELTFRTSDDKFITSLDIELAENDQERAQGLMYRTEMKKNQGMLFIFPYEEIQSFYMKNTILSLDMIFINSELEIVTIRKNTEPYSLDTQISDKPAQYVLETNAGYTDKNKIKVGDRVVFRKIN